MNSVIIAFFFGGERAIVLLSSLVSSISVTLTRQQLSLYPNIKGFCGAKVLRLQIKLYQCWCPRRANARNRFEGKLRSLSTVSFFIYSFVLYPQWKVEPHRLVWYQFVVITSNQMKDELVLKRKNWSSREKTLSSHLASSVEWYLDTSRCGIAENTLHLICISGIK